jgi:hypothetical protein
MGAIIDFIMYFLAGSAVTAAADKYLPSKVPQYQPVGIGFNLKTLVIIISGVAGAMALVFISKKLGLKLFKRR